MMNMRKCFSVVMFALLTKGFFVLGGVEGAKDKSGLAWKYHGLKTGVHVLGMYQIFNAGRTYYKDGYEGGEVEECSGHLLHLIGVFSPFIHKWIFRPQHAPASIEQNKNNRKWWIGLGLNVGSGVVHFLGSSYLFKAGKKFQKGSENNYSGIESKSFKKAENNLFFGFLLHAVSYGLNEFGVQKMEGDMETTIHMSDSLKKQMRKNRGLK